MKEGTGVGTGLGSGYGTGTGGMGTGATGQQGPSMTQQVKSHVPGTTVWPHQCLGCKMCSSAGFCQVQHRNEGVSETCTRKGSRRVFSCTSSSSAAFGLIQCVLANRWCVCKPR